MKIEAQSVQEYLENLPEERKEPIEKLRKIISENLPNGFEEQLSYGMIGYVVPKSIYRFYDEPSINSLTQIPQ